MVSTLINWAIFGAVGVGWNHAITWAIANGNAHEGLIVISLVTMSLMVGKTSGGNGVEHIIAGVKGCLNLLIGWLVALLVFNVMASLVNTGGLDVAALINSVIGSMIVIFASILVFSALNAVRK